MENRPPRYPAKRADEPHSPFRYEAEVMVDRVAQHDDITKTQVRADGAADVSAEHVSELLYDPGYVWDPRPFPRGVEYYPAYPDSKSDVTTEAEG